MPERALRYRIVVAVGIAFPLVVGGAAAVLVARSLAHSWLWGAVAVAIAVAALVLVCVPLAVYGMRHPEAAELLIKSNARAHSGYPIRHSD